jgi:hypothetical protein
VYDALAEGGQRETVSIRQHTFTAAEEGQRESEGAHKLLARSEVVRSQSSQGNFGGGGGGGGGEREVIVGEYHAQRIQTPNIDSSARLRSLYWAFEFFSDASLVRSLLVDRQIPNRFGGNINWDTCARNTLRGKGSEKLCTSITLTCAERLRGGGLVHVRKSKVLVWTTFHGLVCEGRRLRHAVLSLLALLVQEHKY